MTHSLLELPNYSVKDLEEAYDMVSANTASWKVGSKDAHRGPPDIPNEPSHL